MKKLVVVDRLGWPVVRVKGQPVLNTFRLLLHGRSLALWPSEASVRRGVVVATVGRCVTLIDEMIAEGWTSHGETPLDEYGMEVLRDVRTTLCAEFELNVFELNVGESSGS